MGELNELIHQSVRLRIMAALTALPEHAEMEFTTLRDLLKLTDGNLGTHIRKLEDAGYLQVHKTFIGRKPRTFLSVTTQGSAAFHSHVAALKNLLDMGDTHESYT